MNFLYWRLINSNWNHCSYDNLFKNSLIYSFFELFVTFLIIIHQFAHLFSSMNQFTTFKIHSSILKFICALFIYPFTDLFIKIFSFSCVGYFFLIIIYEFTHSLKLKNGFFKPEIYSSISRFTHSLFICQFAE